ncbi:MAG: hypothetical protein KGI91_03460 [Burkholderiales bacterium]|nr:hypothetical protein [Burkholderiales bacterium]MDE2076118.1 hypothetical protein [Burkholderiales bacterium]MDE2433654.1 hypothetical protein [Burkholderiales bacterium]
MAQPHWHSLRLAALASGLCLFALMVLSLSTGANQQHFEQVMAPQVYAHDLLAQAAGLRWIIALDDVFIACYMTVGILFARQLVGPTAHALRPWIVGMSVAAGVLDFLENHHILAMLHQAQTGGVPDYSYLVLRENLSAMKWLLGHSAFFLVGWCLPTHSIPLRLFQWALLFVQLPIGALTLTVQDPAWAPALNLIRLINVMMGFFLVAWLFPSPPTEPQ